MSTIWPTGFAPEALAQWLNERHEGTLMGQLGIRVVSLSPDRAVAELPFHAGISTPIGHAHAGAMLALADTTATYLAIATTGGGLDAAGFPVAIGLTAQIVGNVQQGTLRAESAVAHRGRTLVVIASRVTSDTGRLLALVTTTHFVRGG
jgi:uncharacterized protein (TIGR00369 family)